MSFRPIYKLRDGITTDYLCLDHLALNPYAVDLIEQQFMDSVDWMYLSENPNAIRLLEKNLDKVDWS